MTNAEVVFLCAWGLVAIVGGLRHYRIKKQDRELEREKNSPRPREMNKRI